MVSVTEIQNQIAPSDQIPQIHILKDRCSGCQECIVRCPTGALTLEKSNWIAVGDNEICVGCRQCERTCPFSAIFISGPVIVTPPVKQERIMPEVLAGNFTEVELGINSSEELIRAAERCLQCPDPTCVKGCPAHNDIPGFIAAAKSGDLQKAVEVLSLNSCLPGACSRVCDWNTQCEASCTWTLAGEQAVEIGKIERYIADHAAITVNPGPDNDLEMAVIGSGPAGLAAAYELRKLGAKVTVFEKEDALGGVMRWGIPSYVLPDSAWTPLITELKANQVEFKTNSPIDPNQINDLLQIFDGVICATGANQTIIPKIEGIELEGVEDAKTFLNMAKFVLSSEHYRPVLDGKNVLVIGAGNTAMDVARSVLRLGGSAIAVDWMDERYSRARPDEIADARADGVDVRFLTTVTKIGANSKGVVCNATLSHTIQNGPSSIPKLTEEPSENIEVDMVVTAMGYRVEQEWKNLSNQVSLGALQPGHSPVDRKWLGSGLFATKSPYASLAYNREHARVEAAFPISNGVWAVGDLQIGPSTVVSAMAQGISAARGATADLTNQNLKVSRGSKEDNSKPYLGSALIIHDGSSRSVEQASQYVSHYLWGYGWKTETVNASHVDHLSLIGCDLIIYGVQVEGPLLGGVHPSRNAAKHISELPSLHGKKIATFVVHSLTPRDVSAKLHSMFTNKGGEVIIGGDIHTRHLERDSKVFAEKALEAAQTGNVAFEQVIRLTQ